MAKRVVTSDCPIEHFLDIIGDKWVTLILRDLLKKSPVRFKELQRTLHPVSTKTLTLKLRHLEGHDIIERTVFPEIPPKVEYKLTDKGKSLAPLLEEMKSWYQEWCE